MSVPSNANFTYYVATPLTNTDWANNFHQVVNYLTTTYDVTFNTVNSTTGITSGGTVTAAAFVGDGSGITISGFNLGILTLFTMLGGSSSNL